MLAFVVRLVYRPSVAQSSCFYKPQLQKTMSTSPAPSWGKMLAPVAQQGSLAAVAEGARKLGFVGAGQMATALVAGLLAGKVYRPEEIMVFDLDVASVANLKQEHKVRAASSNLELAKNCSVLVLAVKPAVVPIVLQEMRTALTSEHLLVSVAAGVPTSTLEAHAPQSRVVRVMPNTPALIRAGASCFARGSKATDEDARLVHKLLIAVGTAHEVQDKDMDAVTGLSGSGPAYVFLLLEALADGGVHAGLPRPLAQALTTQTVLGAAQLAKQTGKHPGQLKDSVASPGGTTIAGVATLESNGFRSAAMQAVIAAAARSKELGQPKAKL
eukprot:g66768.t1